MKKILSLFLLMLTVGCQTNVLDKKTITTKDIYKGAEGLEIDFLENAPPDRVYAPNNKDDRAIIMIGLKLENKGAYDINNGYLAVSMEKDYMESDISSFQSTSKKIKFDGEDHIKYDLNGKSVESPKGEEDILTFSAYIRQLEELSQSHKSAIAITSCYQYKTMATETVCIDPDIYNMKKRTKSCEIKDISLNDQGAPVAVTKIETKMLPQEDFVEPQFIIYVENKGDGLVLDKDSIREACSSAALDHSKLNIVEVSAYLTKKGSRIKLDCDPDNDIDTARKTLKDKKAVIRCKHKEGIEEKATYLTPLIIEIDYGYTSTKSKIVEIEKIV